jgi:hypothetical protein
VVKRPRNTTGRDNDQHDNADPDLPLHCAEPGHVDHATEAMTVDEWSCRRHQTGSI